MFMTVRKYDGVKDPQEATKRVKESFVSLLASQPGFVEYQWVDLGDGAMISISIFDNLAHSIEANQTAMGWVRTNLAPFLTQNPRVESGKVVAHQGIRSAVLDLESGARPKLGARTSH